MSNKEIFQRMANKYDNEERELLANKITNELKIQIKDWENKSVLDYGGGTGLVSLPLANDVKHLTISDISENMLDVVQSKIDKNSYKNVSTKHIDYLNQKDSEKYDVIIVSLVLLHIKETKKIIDALISHLKPQGTLLIVDFIKNENVYHEKVHNGFVIQNLEDIIKVSGGKEVTSHEFYTADNLFMKERATLFLTAATI